MDGVWRGKWLKFDLDGEYEISRYVIRHAGDNGLDPSLNTKHYIVETSMDGSEWTVAMNMLIIL